MEDKPNDPEKPVPTPGTAPPTGKFYGNWMLVALVSGAIAFGVMRFAVSLIRGSGEGQSRASAGGR